MGNLILKFIRELLGGDGSAGALLFETIIFFICLPICVYAFLALHKKIKALAASETAADEAEHSTMDPAMIELNRVLKEKIQTEKSKLVFYSFFLVCAFFCALIVFISKLMEYLTIINVISIDMNAPQMKLAEILFITPLIIAILIYAVRTFKNNAGKSEKEHKQYVRYSIYAIFVCTLILVSEVFILSRQVL